MEFRCINDYEAEESEESISPSFFFFSQTIPSSSSCSLLPPPLLFTGPPLLLHHRRASPPSSLSSSLPSRSLLPAGAPALLLPGGGGADLPSSMGRGSGRTQLHVVCSGTGPLRSGPGGSAQGPVRHPAAGLEGRAAQVRTCESTVGGSLGSRVVRAARPEPDGGVWTELEPAAGRCSPNVYKNVSGWTTMMLTLEYNPWLLVHTGIIQSSPHLIQTTDGVNTHDTRGGARIDS